MMTNTWFAMRPIALRRGFSTFDTSHNVRFWHKADMRMAPFYSGILN